MRGASDAFTAVGCEVPEGAQDGYVLGIIIGTVVVMGLFELERIVGTDVGIFDGMSVGLREGTGVGKPAA